MADKLYSTHLSRRVFGSWRAKYEEGRELAREEEREKRHTEEIEEITARLNKELHSLQDKLCEVSTALAQANGEKENM